MPFKEIRIRDFLSDSSDEDRLPPHKNGGKPKGKIGCLGVIGILLGIGLIFSLINSIHENIPSVKEKKQKEMREERQAKIKIPKDYAALPRISVVQYQSEQENEQEIQVQDTDSDQSEEMMKLNADDDYSMLVNALLKDALGLLPDNLKSKIAPDNNLNLIIDSAIKNTPSMAVDDYSINPDVLGSQVACIIQDIYGGTNLSNVAIPQVVYLKDFHDGDAIQNMLAKEKAELGESSNLPRDQYSACLYLLLNQWLIIIQKSGIEITNLPIEGIYLRDSNMELYLYEGA